MLDRVVAGFLPCLLRVIPRGAPREDENLLGGEPARRVLMPRARLLSWAGGLQGITECCLGATESARVKFLD